MGRHVKSRRFSVLSALAALHVVGCGARSSLLEPFQSEIAGGTGSSTAGSNGRGGGGQGGTFSSGGKLGPGGTPGTSGRGGNGLAGVAGCTLATFDCRTEAEANCTGNPECRGDYGSPLTAKQTGTMGVQDVAVSATGRVAIAGWYFGTVDFGGNSAPLTSDAWRSFAASFDAAGQAEWAYALEVDGSTYGIAVRFASEDVLLLSSHDGDLSSSLPYAALLTRLGKDGASQWLRGWGTPQAVEATSLAVDNDGSIWTAGSYSGELDYFGATLPSPPVRASYVIRTDARGAPIGAYDVSPPGWVRAGAVSIAVDDEDSLLVAGDGKNGAHLTSAYVLKVSAGGEAIFLKELTPTPTAVGPEAIYAPGLAVDRQMRVVVAGSFAGRLEHEGEVFEAKTNQGAAWVAQFSREGELTWQQAFEGASFVSAATTDPFGNVLLGGNASRRLEVQGEEYVGTHGVDTFGYLVKLRPNGRAIWTRQADGLYGWDGIATDGVGNIWAVGTFYPPIWLGDDLVESGGTDDQHGLLVRLSP